VDRKQNPMAFVTIEDGEGQAEAVIFSDVLEKYRACINQDSVLLLDGKVSCRNGGEGKLLVTAVSPVDEEHIPESKEVHLFIDVERMGEGIVKELKQLLPEQENGAALFFHMRKRGETVCLIRSRSTSVNLDFKELNKLCDSLGSNNIRIIPTSTKE
jgi:DNA polymerase III alpha subunit